MLLNHKTKIVATIGPASDTKEVLINMINAGLDIARLNFSHGDFTMHAGNIKLIREAAQESGRRVAIMADMPGPKMRVGVIEPEPIHLNVGDEFILTTDDIIGNEKRVSQSFEKLPQVVKRKDRLFLNDGLIQLIVRSVDGNDVNCRVVVGGELRSRKGLNLPGIDLGISAFTDHDYDCLKFALEHGVDAVSQSFVETADDIKRVRKAAHDLGKNPLIIAKIERSGALEHLDEILEEADGIMVARGDLGVEVPIEEIALIQKRIIAAANAAGKPVITATQMLESMTNSRLPTRAEATDVANAILDGTDCIMLSGESAMGKYPVEAIEMLAKIAASTENGRIMHQYVCTASLATKQPENNTEAIARVVKNALETTASDAIFVPTRSGNTARMISGFKPPVWIIAINHSHQVAQNLVFSYGVKPEEIDESPEHWGDYAREWIKKRKLPFKSILLVAGPSKHHPKANLRLEFMQISE